MSWLGIYMSIAPEPHCRDSHNSKPLVSIYKSITSHSNFCERLKMHRICAAFYATPKPECEIYQFLSSCRKVGKQVVIAANPSGKDSAEAEQTEQYPNDSA